MIDSAKLKYHCEVKRITIEQLANKIGINPSTLNRKMKGETDFYRHEISLIKEILDLSIYEMLDIFFKNELAEVQEKV